jgi:predicted phosphate transport protein (TIGR00153 family)
MIRSIIPKEEVFFDNFEQICVLIVESAEKLKAMLIKGRPFDESARSIKKIEREVDQEVQQTVIKLHKTFVTPFDRQDILKLTTGLDDILDMIEAVSSLLKLYDPRQVVREAGEIADVLTLSTMKVAEMVESLRNLKKQSSQIFELAATVSQLENDADQLYQDAIAWLFREEHDIKELIKWKDILEHIEAATDRCEDVSDIIEGIALENA